MVRKWIFFSLGLVALTVLVISGCSGKSSPLDDANNEDARKPTPDAKDAEHAHKPGSHGGIIVSIGRDNYHAEAIFEKGGVLRLLLLDRDETKVLEVESQTLTAYIKRIGDTDSASFILKPEPQPEDAKGKTSQFLGRFPRELDGQKLEVTIPSIRIVGERFRVPIKNYSEEGDGHESPMPVKAEDEDERKLYLTPGGKYTEADIQANGRMTASRKFKGLMASHNIKPKAGDRVCPVTLTRADSRFSWVINGKTYQFCCPPCVDELVATAKEKPDELKDPEKYIKK